jgi:hypothetical protein
MIKKRRSVTDGVPIHVSLDDSTSAQRGLVGVVSSRRGIR